MLCSDVRLATLSESREARHLLDLVWNDGGVRYCLEQAQWHFAMRSTRLDYEPAVTPQFGLSRAFTKPDDWVATSGVFQDEFQKQPLTQYADEAGYWFADLDEIFVKIVSDGAGYGADMTKWPATFTEYVKAYFASKIIRKLPGGAAKIDDICHPKTGELAKALTAAKNRAAMTQPATFPTRGTWVAARMRGVPGSRTDGGNPNQLIG